MSDFTDALVNKLAPDTQVAPIITPNDQIAESEMLFAEQIGNKLLEQINGAVLTAAPIRFTDTTNSPFSIADIGRYIVIRSGVNVGTYRVASFVDVNNVDMENTDGTSPVFTTQTGIDYAIHDEPSLESNLNHMITQLREIVDPSQDWFQNMPKAFNPNDTDSGNIKNEKMNLKVLSDNWYGTHTKVIDVVANLSPTNTDTGLLFTTSLGYGDAADRRGLVIQDSIGNAYHDEIALASIILGKHKVTISDVLTGQEFFNVAGNLVYGVLQDGADHTGAGEGTDVFIKFVEDVAGVPTAYTWVTGDPTSILAYMPYRKRRTELLEYDERRYMVAGIVGDAEQSQDIAEIREALGIGDGDGAGDFDLTNTTNFFPFSTLNLATATMEDIVNSLNQEIGDRDYTTNNFLTDGETITESLEALDIALGGASGIKSKILERLSANVGKGVAHTIPFASGTDAAITTYLQDTTNNGLNMDIYVGGNKLIPDSSASTTDGDYEETSSTSITFRFNVNKLQVIEYVIRDTV
jgi:hypothetical protein